MIMIEIASLENGAHRNQTYSGFLPDGWALVPDNLETDNFPFGEITVEDMDGRTVVATWSPLPMPEPEPEQEPEPTQLDMIEAQVTYTAMMTDTLLEV